MGTVVEDSDGKRRDRSKAAPEVVLPDFNKPDPLLTFSRGRAQDDPS
jgi:hypothetical protein